LLKIVSFNFGVGAGHFFGGLTLWQSLKINLGKDFHFSLLHDLPIDVPFEDETLEPLLIPLEPDSLFQDTKSTILYQYLKHLDPDLIIVDTIWIVAAPFLDLFKAKKVFYSVYMPNFWFGFHPWDTEMNFPFHADQFDLCLSRDPGFSFDSSINIAPVINVPESLIKPPEIIRSVLSVPEDKKLALVAHNGEEGEIEGIIAHVDLDLKEYCLRSISSHDDASKSLFPLSHYMSGIDLAIGGCGDHFFYETKFYKIPSIYLPQPRIGNEQHWRLENCLDYEGPYDGADQMIKMILDLF